MKGSILTGLFRATDSDSFRGCAGDLILRFIWKQKTNKKQAKNWTRNVIYISIVQVFHPTDVEIEVSKRFLSSIRSRWSVLFVFNWNNISRSIIRDFVDKSWFGYDHGHVTGTCLIFEWPKKKNCKNNICSRSPGDHDCGKLFLQVVVFRKLLAENWLDKLYCTDHTYSYFFSLAKGWLHPFFLWTRSRPIISEHEKLFWPRLTKK